MKTRFSTVDLRAVLAELNARYRMSGDQACAGGAGGRDHGPTVEISRKLKLYETYNQYKHRGLQKGSC